MTRNYLALFVALAVCSLGRAQTVPTAERFTRQQVAVEGGALFSRKLMSSGVLYEPTSAGAGGASYRINFTRWFGAEADYDFFRNSQKYSISSATVAYPVTVQAATAAVVINLPNPITKRFRSYATVGGGEIFFTPRDASFLTTQRRSVVAIGGGADLPISRHIAIRVQAKTLVYKPSDFGSADLKVNKYAQAMIPSLGLVFNF